MPALTKDELDAIDYFFEILRFDDIEDWRESMAKFPSPSAAIRPLVIEARIVDSYSNLHSLEAFADEDTFDDLRALLSDVTSILKAELVAEGQYGSDDLEEELSYSKEESEIAEKLVWDSFINVAKSEVLSAFDPEDNKELISLFRPVGGGDDGSKGLN